VRRHYELLVRNSVTTRVNEELLSRKAGLLAQTALARHRAIGGHARGPRMALRQRQLLGHFGAGPKEYLVRRLPTEHKVRNVCAHSSENSGGGQRDREFEGLHRAFQIAERIHAQAAELEGGRT